MNTTPYLQHVRDILDFLEQTQGPAITAAADLVVDALTHGGTVNCAEIGHGIHMDFLNRAGGLVAVQPFSWNITVTNPLPETRRREQADEIAERDLEQVRMALQCSSLRAGDVMVVGSVSGRNRRPVELALACRERGIKVIGFTSLTYSKEVVSLHPSGKRLFEVVDVAVDNGAPYGDAAVRIPGYDVNLIPLSGVSMLTCGWLIWEQVLTRMAEAGSPASVLISANRDGGREFNAVSRNQYNERGF